MRTWFVHYTIEKNAHQRADENQRVEPGMSLVFHRAEPSEMTQIHQKRTHNTQQIQATSKAGGLHLAATAQLGTPCSADQPHRREQKQKTSAPGSTLACTRANRLLSEHFNQLWKTNIAKHTKEFRMVLLPPSAAVFKATIAWRTDKEIVPIKQTSLEIL